MNYILHSSSFSAIKEKFKAAINFIIKNEFRVFLLLLAAGILFKLIFIFFSIIWQNDSFYYIQGAKVITDGGILYKDFGDIKAPLIFFMHALLIIMFGYENIFLSIKIMTICFQTFAAFFIFKAGEKLYDRLTGFVLSFFFLMIISINYLLWQENVMLFFLLPVTISIYFLVNDEFSIKYKNVFLSAVFAGLTFTMSTNTIFYSIIFPLTSYLHTKNLKKAVKITFIAFPGYVLPAAIFIFYFWLNNALYDAYWWNIKWAAMYGHVESLFLRVTILFYGLIKHWEWIPLYISLCLALKNIFHKKPFLKDRRAVFVLVLFAIGLFSRLALFKSVVRYNLFLLPGILLILPYAKENLKNKKLIGLFTIIIISGFCFNIYSALANAPFRHSMEKRPEIYSYIKTNSAQSDKIFVWNEGYEIYYCARRGMATSFFAPFHHLYSRYLTKDHFSDIEYPWEKFLSELKRDRPKLLVDLTGNFSVGENNSLQEKLNAYRERLMSFAKNNYNEVPVNGQTKIWVRKE